MFEIFASFFIDVLIWSLLFPAMELTGYGLFWLVTLGQAKCDDAAAIAIGFAFWIIVLAVVLRLTLHGTGSETVSIEALLHLQSSLKPVTEMS